MGRKASSRQPIAWDAAQAMKRNVAFNGGAAAAKVRPQQGDARIVMMQNAGVRFLHLSACRDAGAAWRGSA